MWGEQTRPPVLTLNLLEKQINISPSARWVRCTVTALNTWKYLTCPLRVEDISSSVIRAQQSLNFAWGCCLQPWIGALGAVVSERQILMLKAFELFGIEWESPDTPIPVELKCLPHHMGLWFRNIFSKAILTVAAWCDHGLYWERWWSHESKMCDCLQWFVAKAQSRSEMLPRPGQDLLWGPCNIKPSSHKVGRLGDWSLLLKSVTRWSHCGPIGFSPSTLCLIALTSNRQKINPFLTPGTGVLKLVNIIRQAVALVQGSSMYVPWILILWAFFLFKCIQVSSL